MDQHLPARRGRSVPARLSPFKSNRGVIAPLNGQRPETGETVRAMGDSTLTQISAALPRAFAWSPPTGTGLAHARNRDEILCQVAAFRHYLALALTVFMPPMLLYWCLLHPWVRFWRQIGPLPAMTALWGVVALGMAGLFALRNQVQMGDYGTNPALFVAGVICLCLAAWLRRKLARHLTFRTLIGLPEIAPQRYPQSLVTAGLYARVRHPRYLQILLALLGWSLLANHLASYAACSLWLPGVWAIALLEERELQRRFGRAYEEYCQRVPRFVPRWRGLHSRAQGMVPGAISRKT